jgi:fimbrial chaperone protein
MKPGALWFCTALFSLAAASAAAGSFSVSPTRVEMTGGKRTAVISLRNVDSSPLTVQISMVGWTQSDGEDIYSPSRDLLATPPVFTIPANGEQIVRIALRRAPDAVRELPYRIFFQEVPQALRISSNTLNVALRVGVPVFVHATRPEEGMYLDWTATRLKSGELMITAANSGNTHVQVTGFDLLFGAATQGLPVSAIKYVLPGSNVSWLVTPPEGADLSRLRINGYSDHGEFAADAAVVAPH